MQPGSFVTFEGGEGTGKSTQVQIFEQRLRDRGHVVLRTREPGGSPLAERTRNLLLSGVFKQCGPEVEAVLFALARADHLHRAIIPALHRGDVVVCDRFFDSTQVYQAITGADPGLLDILRREATGGRNPDITIVLDLKVEVAARRAAARRGDEVPDRFEGEDHHFHAAVRDGFLAIAEAEPDRCVVVDATGTVEEVAEKVLEAVLQRLPHL